MSKESRPLISLCIPTNGVIEWVFNSLESIYQQNVSNDLFEVIVTDNGNNLDFENEMRKYALSHENVLYAKTDAEPFVNEIEAYKRARGHFIKYLNHRSLLLPDSLNRYIAFVRDNWENRPIVYFANGVLNGRKDVRRLDSFDLYIRELSYFSSWSTGMAFWKDDFDKVIFKEDLDKLFPHTAILFNERDRKEYIVDNQVYLGEQNPGSIPKAKYDLFYAFAVDYPSLLLELRRQGAISTQTFLCVKNELLRFIIYQYYSFCIKKKPCSYDLNSFKESIKVFYSKGNIARAIAKEVCDCIRMKLFFRTHN